MKKFFSGLYRKIVLWIMQTRFYAWLLLHIIPYIRVTTYYTKLRGWKYMRGYKKVKNGDFIVVVDNLKLTHFLIPGEFSHAALVIEKGAEWEVSEMTHHNYTKSTFFDICKEADRVVICRCRDWDDEYVKNVLVPECRSFVDVPYDLTFELGVKSLYCSEMVYQSDVEHRLQCSLEDLAGLGRPYISPVGLYHAKNIDIVWDSDKETALPGFF